MYAPFKRVIINELAPLATLVSAVFLVTVLVRYAIVPGWLHGTSIRKEVFNYQKFIRRDDQFEGLKIALRDQQQALEKKHTSLTQGLADPHDLSGLLQMIFDKAWEAEIRFDKTVPQPELKGTDYIHYPVLLEMTTTYTRLGKFIASLERIPQIVHVDRVAITAMDDDTMQVRLLITCFINLH